MQVQIVRSLEIRVYPPPTHTNYKNKKSYENIIIILRPTQSLGGTGNKYWLLYR